MTKQRTANRLFNAHTGAVSGLVVGVVLGSLLLSVAAADQTGGIKDRVRSVLDEIASKPVPAESGS